MPQLDRLTYILQNIWLILFLSLIYYFFSAGVLPFFIRNILVRLKFIQQLKIYFVYIYFFRFKILILNNVEKYVFFRFSLKKVILKFISLFKSLLKKKLNKLKYKIKLLDFFFFNIIKNFFYFYFYKCIHLWYVYI